EHRGLLRQIAQTELRAPVHGQESEIRVAEVDAPGVARHQAYDHVEGGRLAGPVRSEQAHDLAVGYLQRQIAHHLARPVALAAAAVAAVRQPLRARKPHRSLPHVAHDLIRITARHLVGIRPLLLELRRAPRDRRLGDTVVAELHYRLIRAQRAALLGADAHVA